MARTVLLTGGVQALVLSCMGCAELPLPLGDAGLTSGLISGLVQTAPTQVAADVTAVDEETGLPVSLAGTIGGAYAGTYREQILEVYFDAAGMPLAALSCSTISIDSPRAGTITTFNLIVVTDMILMTAADGAPLMSETGEPVVIGLRSSATGEIVHAEGAYAGATGQLHADSALYFTAGAYGLGTLESTFEFKWSRR
jgi:hypothetical protein